MTETAPAAQKRHARVDAADVLRGFAVMAIILLHSIEHFNFYSFPDTAGQSQWLNFTDKAIWDGLFFLFGGKAYAIFALLFGFSFFIQHDNQRMRGKDFRARFCWRLFLLFVIGNINACFFTGEVLVLYSLVGFVLVLTCRLPDRPLLWLAAVCMLQPVCLWQIANAVADPSYEIAHINSAPFWRATMQAQSSGTFMEMLRVNIWEGQLASLAWAWENGRVFQTAGLFILGMLIGRNGWFRREYLDRWSRVLALSLVCFFPLYGLNGMLRDYISNPNILEPLGILVSSLMKLCFMFMLVSGILFGYYRAGRLSRILGALIPYGKLSMTNYVTQGIIGSFLFYHWGLFLRMGITASVFVGVAIFVVQYMLCRFWVGRHKHGPLEYLWKKATWI
ncbi:MAG: DUF418 domain-containing protein [Muribaculaceae bacterium]|nr:DUF418 domain-containing protein [Muribaculaceae bacterium]